jgi:hypothetical protein
LSEEHPKISGQKEFEFVAISRDFGEILSKIGENKRERVENLE